MLRRTTSAIFLLFLWMAPVQAQDYRLWPLPETRPGHVYTLWSNINGLLEQIALSDSRKSGRMDEFHQLRLKDFDGKIPRDVLGIVNRFRTFLDRQRNLQQLAGTASSRAGPGHLVEPKTVFINSLLVLDSLQEWERTVYASGLDYAPFYRFTKARDITPSDVFGQVDLAFRRLKFLTE